MSNTRVEQDSMGELQVPTDALYAARTQRAVENFPISGARMPEPFIRALIKAKRAAALANGKLEQLSEPMARAIVEACDKLLKMKDLMQHFPVDVYQTGSGTSSNMNANEVLARVATDILGDTVGANDHINCSQSSNDIIPSTIHISAAIEMSEQLLPALEHLFVVIRKKGQAIAHHIKTGRTHLMDAMPVSMEQSLDSWASQIELNIERTKLLLPQLQTLAQGGTAVGTGINAHPAFAAKYCEELNAQCQ